MFEELSDRMQGIVKKLRGQGKLTEKNIDESLRQVRRALLEADVNFKVARAFIESVKTKALGQGVLRNLSPGQQMIGIVNQELISLMGEEAVEIGLVDSLETSDNYLVGLSKKAKLFEIEFIEKKNLSEKFAFSMQLIIEKSIIKFYDLINRDRFTS